MPDSPDPSGPSPRFLRIQDVAAELDTSDSQVSALLRSGDLRGIKIGGRGVWRIERSELERWIAERYQQTKQNLASLPESFDDEPN